MTVRDGWPAESGVVDQIELRRNLAGLIVRDTSGNPRAGIFPRHMSALVSATATMNVSVAAFEAAAVRAGGPVFLHNDGASNVLLPAAPVANSRYDIVWARQKENGYGGLADGSNGAELGYTSGAASAAPNKAAALAAIPAGAIPLAAVLIPSTATATNSAGVVITQEFPYTTTTGSVLPCRTDTERDAAAVARPGQLVYRMDKGWIEEYMSSGVPAAGWYPVAGALPYGRVERQAGDDARTGGAWTIESSTSDWAGGVRRNIDAWNGTWVVPVTGMYDLSAFAYFSGGSNSAVRGMFTKNNAAASTAGCIEQASGAFVWDNAIINLKASNILLTAGDIVRFLVFPNASNTLHGSATIAGQHISMAYVAPPVG